MTHHQNIGPGRCRSEGVFQNGSFIRILGQKLLIIVGRLAGFQSTEVGESLLGIGADRLNAFPKGVEALYLGQYGLKASDEIGRRRRAGKVVAKVEKPASRGTFGPRFRSGSKLRQHRRGDSVAPFGG